MKLKDKVAIVTGSNMGIGKAIALQLGREGARVVLNGRNEERLEKTLEAFRREGLAVTACQADVSIPGDCRKLVAHAIREFGRIDILVNNAGISAKGFFEDFQPEIFSRLIETNVLGSLYATLEALPYIKAGRGSILFISSLSGLHGLPHQSPYSLTKMAQTAIAESLRAELYHEGVHIGIIYVGVTQNDPEKKIFFSDGVYRNLQNGMNGFADTQDQVAKAVFHAILKRQFKVTVGWKGEIYFLLSRYFPWVLDYTFRNHLEQIVKTDS